MFNEHRASQCYDITTSLSGKDIPDFEFLPKVGMMINLSMHLRGLPLLDYEKLKLVSSHYFRIQPILLRDILESLAEIEFVKIYKQKSSIKQILPQIPYFDNIYKKIGEYANSEFTLNESEQLALAIVDKLTDAPTDRNNMFLLGAEKKLVDRNLQLGGEGNYILSKRARGKDILISPIYFSENADVFADLTAKAGAPNIKRILDLVKKAQGWPLSIIEKHMNINGESINVQDLQILKRLAQDGAVKPPSITTGHSGQNFFMFTPTPGGAKLNATNREIYERAMALIASVRQGQLLADKYQIKWPVAILKALKRDGWLRPTSETYAQYNQLAILKVGRLEKVSSERHKFVLINEPENTKALDLAIELIEEGGISNMEINQEARIALQRDQTYIESIVSSTDLRRAETVVLDEEAKEEFENLLLKASAK